MKSIVALVTVTLAVGLTVAEPPSAKDAVAQMEDADDSISRLFPLLKQDAVSIASRVKDAVSLTHETSRKFFVSAILKQYTHLLDHTRFIVDGAHLDKVLDFLAHEEGDVSDAYTEALTASIMIMNADADLKIVDEQLNRSPDYEKKTDLLGIVANARALVSVTRSIKETSGQLDKASKSLHKYLGDKKTVDKPVSNFDGRIDIVGLAPYHG